MQLTIIKTFVSRFLILILSFGLVIYSTNMWGSEGKGTISIVVANAAAVKLFSAAFFSGSSASYFASRFRIEKVLLYAYLWSLLTGLLIPFFIQCSFYSGRISIVSDRNICFFFTLIYQYQLVYWNTKY